MLSHTIDVIVSLKREASVIRDRLVAAEAATAAAVASAHEARTTAADAALNAAVSGATKKLKSTGGCVF
jgi:hypothetical protein